MNNPVAGSTINGSASVGGGGGSGAAAICASGLSGGGSGRSSSVAPVAGISAKPKAKGIFKKESTRRFKRKKRTVVIGKSRKITKAKKGKVKLKINFNKRKLAKLLHNKRRVRTVVRITIKVRGKAQPLVGSKVVTLKRKGTLGKKKTKAKRKKSRRSQASAAQRVVVESVRSVRSEDVRVGLRSRYAGRSGPAATVAAARSTSSRSTAATASWWTPPFSTRAS